MAPKSSFAFLALSFLRFAAAGEYRSRPLFSGDSGDMPPIHQTAWNLN